MRARLIAAAAALLFVLVAAAVTLPLSSLNVRGEGLLSSVSERISVDGEIDVIVRGEGVANGGIRLRVPYDCTYGELFALAGIESASGFDLSSVLSREDAVLVDGAFILYIVV